MRYIVIARMTAIFAQSLKHLSDMQKFQAIIKTYKQWEDTEYTNQNHVSVV